MLKKWLLLSRDCLLEEHPSVAFYVTNKSGSAYPKDGDTSQRQRREIHKNFELSLFYGSTIGELMPHADRERQIGTLYNGRFSFTSQSTGDKHCRYNEG